MPHFSIRLPQRVNSRLMKYALATLVTLAALLLRVILDPWLGASAAFVTIFPAIVFSALLLGVGPAALTTVLGLVGVNFFIMSPKNAFSLGREDYLVLLAYVGTAAFFVVAVAEASRRSYRKAQGQLEKKVAQRTRELADSVAKLESEIQVRKEAEEHLRSLSAHVLSLQDGERRRIAREMHDSVAQSIFALKMKLDSFRDLVADIPEAGDLLGDLTGLTDQASAEIRAIAYLLHPPLLSAVGFSSAAERYLDGFSKRSGIEINFELSPLRLRKEAEVLFFRVMQESLTNVVRHSGSNAVDICLDFDEQHVVLSIRDYGMGIPSEKLSSFYKTGAGVGVGLTGMRERVGEMGGQFTIESDDKGTCVTVRLSRATAEEPSAEIDRASATSAGA